MHEKVAPKNLTERMEEVFRIYRFKLHELEAAYALAVYRAHGENVSRTSKVLGCSYRKAWELINGEIQGGNYVREKAGTRRKT
jgi:hypothetical protein